MHMPATIRRAAVAAALLGLVPSAAMAMDGTTQWTAGTQYCVVKSPTVVIWGACGGEGIVCGSNGDCSITPATTARPNVGTAQGVEVRETAGKKRPIAPPAASTQKKD